MTDLRNTIAHILEHKQHLAEANEATTQQYVVLPILRALGWDDTNLASMEVLPEYKVESRRADYALHIKHNQNPVVLVECKKWDQPIGKSEEQICFYAYSGNVPLAIITNGKRWRFYLETYHNFSQSLNSLIKNIPAIDSDLHLPRTPPIITYQNLSLLYICDLHSNLANWLLTADKL